MRLLEAVLEAAGFAVSSASSGPETVERVVTELPDLVLLDVQMAGIEPLRGRPQDPRERGDGARARRDGHLALGPLRQSGARRVSDTILFGVFHKLLVTATLVSVPRPFVQALEKSLRSRSWLGGRCLRVGAWLLLLWKKPRRVPEIDVQSLDLFNEHQDRSAGRSDLFTPVPRQALTPAPERLELLLVEHCLRRPVRQRILLASQLRAYVTRCA